MSSDAQSDADFLADWHGALRQAGWEAITSETLGEVAARLEQDNSVWSLVVDTARRFKFVASRPLAPEVWSGIEVDGRSYAGHHEYGHTLTITGTLSPGTLPETLLADLAFAAEAPALETD